MHGPGLLMKISWRLRHVFTLHPGDMRLAQIFGITTLAAKGFEAQ